MDKAEKFCILLIADISGYTKFMLKHKTEKVHAQAVISELIETIINEVEIPLEIAKLEGDAIFLYCAKENEEQWAIHKKFIKEKIFRFFTVFSQKLGDLTQSNICNCSACMHIKDLKIKIIAHCGDVHFYKLHNFNELSGVDVIILHRLLKNSIKSDEYILLTDATMKELAMEQNHNFSSSYESYKEIGKIKVHSYIPQKIESKKMSKFLKFKTEISKMFRGYRYMFSKDKTVYKHLDI
jgi:hypothetical protein